MNMLPMALGGLQSGAQARDSGQNSGFLGGPNAIDGSTTSFWNLFDPFNTTGHSSSGHALANVLDPGNVFGFNQAANPNAGQNPNSPTALPNLGANTMIPQTPMGHFTNQGFGSGPYNNMVMQSAGGRFVPTYAMPHQTMPQTIPQTPSPKGTFPNSVVSAYQGLAQPMMVRKNADKTGH